MKQQNIHLNSNFMIRYIDFTLQTLLFMAALATLITAAFAPDTLVVVMIVQFFIGVWQVLSCVFSMIAYSNQNNNRRNHILIAALYVLSLFVFPALVNHDLSIFPEWVIIVYATVPAWSLALYYYWITITGTFPNRIKRGNFLPNISF